MNVHYICTTIKANPCSGPPHIPVCVRLASLHWTISLVLSQSDSNHVLSKCVEGEAFAEAQGLIFTGWQDVQLYRLRTCRSTPSGR